MRPVIIAILVVVSVLFVAIIIVVTLVFVYGKKGNVVVVGQKIQNLMGKKKQTDESFDVAIVGGGVGGLYCAWRLIQTFPELKIAVIEQGDRIGGRLESLPIQDSPKAAELGGTEMILIISDDIFPQGMRYFPLYQPFTETLVKKLELPSLTVPYVAPENVVYVRGVRTRIRDLPDIAGVIYNLPDSEKGKTSEELARNAINETLRKLGIPDEDVETNPFLNSVTYWKVLYDGSSNEAVEYYRDINGYNFSIDDLSAATGISEDKSIGPAANSQQMFLQDGYEQLPKALYDSVKAVVDVRLLHLVQKFKLDSNGVTLTVQKIGPKNIQDLIVPEWLKRGSPFKIRAKRLILTLCTAYLYSLYDWPSQVLNDLQRTMPWEGTKIFIEFDRAWWKEFGLSKGRSVTDLPMRQVWYWNEDPAILMIYCDNIDAVYWRSLLPAQVYPSWQDPITVPLLVQELKRQLSQMFGIPEISLIFKRMSWRFWPFGNYFTRPGKEIWKTVQDRMIQPLGHDKQVYVASDCFSNNQSWVNGTVENCDRMLNQGWNIPSILFERSSSSSSYPHLN